VCRKRSPSFVASSPLVPLLDRLAQRYGTRPSALLQLDDQAEALDFDLAVMTRAREERLAAIQDAADAGDETDQFFTRVLLLLMEQI
jgi:hypothetical protein